MAYGPVRLSYLTSETRRDPVVSVVPVTRWSGRQGQRSPRMSDGRVSQETYFETICTALARTSDPYRAEPDPRTWLRSVTVPTRYAEIMNGSIGSKAMAPGMSVLAWKTSAIAYSTCCSTPAISTTAART